MTDSPVKRITLSFVAVFMLATLAIGVEGYYVNQTRNLTQANKQSVVENKRRIAVEANLLRSIQLSRTSSCKQTYEAIREVIRPFFPKVPTVEQRAIRDQFDRTINRRKRHCDTQTKPEEPAQE